MRKKYIYKKTKVCDALGHPGRRPPGRAPTPRPRGLAWRGEMAAAGGLWSCEDPSRWAAVLECRGAVLRARAGPQGRLEALDRW